MISLDDVFSPSGLLEEAIDFYTYRDGQYEMAKNVLDAFENEKIAVLEAGTGTGKSFAYLVPSVLEIIKSKKTKVVIATSNKTLQDQLYEKDIPIVTKALNAKIPVATLYGRSNYLCQAAFRGYEEDTKLLENDESLPFNRLRLWAEETKTGLLSEVKGREERALFQELSSDSNTCRASKCPYFETCFFYRAKAKARAANIIVTNHHLFILDGRAREESGEGYDEDLVLPSFDFAIIDEAHNLEKSAPELLSSSFHFSSFSKTVENIIGRDKSIKDNKSKLEYCSIYTSSRNATIRFKNALERIKRDAEALDERLKMLSALKDKPNEVIISDENRYDFYSVQSLSENIGRDLKNSINEYLTYLNRDSQEDDASLKLLIKNINALECSADVLTSFFNFTDYSKGVPYFALENYKEALYSYKITPTNTAELLKEIFYEKIKAIIMSSATLTVGSTFDHFLSEMGLTDLDVIKASYDSPFDFKRNLMLLRPLDALPFDKGKEDEYIQYLSQAVKEAIEISSGGALVLFTSFKMLDEVYKSVNDEIGKDIKIYHQERGGGKSRAELLSLFKEEKDSCLFATQSFWEGIDAPGDTLRLVIITKLPFTTPQSPLEIARRENFSDDRKYFNLVSLPNAVLKFKQGVGRLIRSESDRGVILILDGRVVTKYYGSTFITSIPECYHPECRRESVSEKIEAFLY